MDTSTPVGKQKTHIFHDGLRRRAMENDCERNSSVLHSNDRISPEEDAELVYSQPPNDTRLDRSEELFPFSPIPYRKEVPSTLLPLLDTPDIRWTSSVFTSFHGHSEIASPEVLSEDNFVRTICVDSHVENNARYTTDSYFNSQVPDFSHDTNNASVPPPHSYTERNSNRPSPPIVVPRKKEKKFSSVNKELFPFRTANEEDSQEPSASLECGAMGDLTLNALEQICIDSEIMYSRNSSKKSNTVNTSCPDEAASLFISDSSIEQGKHVIQRENKRNFIYPIENVKKPDAPVLMTDILQTVLALETNEISNKVPRKKENFCQGLVCFSQLEPSSSQTAENKFSPSLTASCEPEIDTSWMAASYEIVGVIYLPVFFCSREMSTDDRDMLTILKKYFECYRVRFAQSISEGCTRRELSSTFVDCSRAKFSNLNFSAAIIDSFFEFFILHPDLMYNYRLSRRFCVSNRTTKRHKTQFCDDEIQLFSILQSLPPFEPTLLDGSQSSMKLDKKSFNVSSNKRNDSCEVPLYQKTNKIEKDLTSAALNQNPFVSDKHSFSNAPMRNNAQVSCEKSEPKNTDEEAKGCANERLLLQKSTFTSYKKEMLELGAAFISASEKYDCVDVDVIERAKKLLEDITAGLARSSEKPHLEKPVEKSDSTNCPRVNPLINASKKSDLPDQNSATSKTPFDVDIDSADLMFICDLSEKTVLPEKSLNLSEMESGSRKIAKVTEKSPQRHSKSLKNLSKNSSTLESSCPVSLETKVTAEAPSTCDPLNYSNFIGTSTGFSKNHHSPTLASKSPTVMRSSMKKCSLEPFAENSGITLPKSLLGDRTIMLDDIENWNPDLAVMMTPVEIKKQLIHSRSSKKEIENVCSNRESIFALTNNFAFDAFNTAGGRRINVKPNSFARAKKSMDAVQIEPEMMEEQFLNRKKVSSASGMDKVDLVSSPDKSRISAEKSSSRRLTKPPNRSESVTIDGLLPQLSSYTKNIFSSSVKDSPTKLEFTADELLNQVPEPLVAQPFVNQFPAFSTASGKKMGVAEKFLAAGKKIYESTAEEKSIDEIKPSKNDSYPRFPPKDSNATKKMNSRESAHQLSKHSIFTKPSTSSTLNKFEAESPHQLGGFCSAAGKKLTVAESNLKGAEKMYASISNEPFFESAQDQLFASIDEIKSSKNDLSLQFPSEVSNTTKKMNSRDSAHQFSKPNIFTKPSTSSSLNKFEVESPHQLGGFCSAAGKKLSVAQSNLKGAEKLYASISDEPFFGSAQDQPFASFNSASGKKIGVSSSLLEKGKKLYESTLEETKLCKSESTREIDSFSKPVQLVAKTARKMNVTNESLQRAQKLFEDCFNDDCMNEFTLKPASLSSSPQLSTFASAAGKTINVAKKKLSDAQKIFQAVSAETMVSMEKMGDLSDDFFPCKNKVPSNSKSSDVSASKSPRLQRLKRSFNEDSLQNLPSFSSHMDKKMRTDEDSQKVEGKLGEIVEESKFCEENLTIPPDCGASYELEQKSAASVLEPPIVTKQQLDSLSCCSQDDIFQKSPSLDDSMSLKSEIINIKSPCDLRGTESAAEMENNPTLLNLSQEISESTSAFLHDMKNDDLAFDPVHSSSCSGAVEPEAKIATPEISRSSSPVFDSCKPSSKKRSRKRRSQHSLSLNPLEVTYVRKEPDNSASNSTHEEVLQMFHQNFAQKVSKRKEPSSNMMYPSSKKAKDSNENDSILEQRKQAALEQQKLISKKDEQLCKPRIGSILAEKLRGDRKSLREMVNYVKPQRYSVSKLLQCGLKRSVVNVNADNAHEFIFTADFLSADEATYGDECVVIASEKNEVYFEDLARAFLASPGVDPRLISLPWIRNHYRWIIWKLASTEKSYPNIFGGRYLTLNNVLLQLKFRYDWEVDRCCRSALKRILECDSSPSETMILCVANIKTIVASLNEYEIEMTDGWYSVPCLFDGEMLKLLTQKKVTVGTKLVIMNAELTGAGEGCDPLQPNMSARLKIATNSARRARWYAPLGFHHDNPIVISDLRAILPNGGTVPQFTAAIARVYPMLYLDKKDDGSFTLHNEKVQFKKMSDFEKRRQMCLDKLLSQITSEVEKENQLMDSDDRNTDSDSDPIAYQNRRYNEQERLQILIQERVKQKLPEEFQTPKRTSSMLKVRLINKDAHDDSSPGAMLTIWHPPEDLVSLLSEGKLYEFHKVVAGGLRNGQVQLTANRQTKYKHLSAGDLSCYGRRVTSFGELKTDFKVAFGECDIVGLVIRVKEIENNPKNDSTPTIYLADLNKNLMIVKFRTNVKDFGFEDTLKLHNVIAGLNLQWKRSLCNGQIPIVFASELSSFVYSSRCQHLQKCIDKFHSCFKNENLNDFVAECQEKLNDLLSGPGPIATSTPQRSNQLPSLPNENSCTSEPTDGSLKQNNSADSSDVSWNATSKSVHSRIEKLRGYGEPPSLSPIAMCSRRRSSRLSIQTRVHKLSISKN